MPQNTLKTEVQSENIHLTQTNLSSFLNSCRTIGIKSDDFEMMLRSIVDYVIDAADEHAPTRELKRPLLFLRTLETFLNSIEVN